MKQDISLHQQSTSEEKKEVDTVVVEEQKEEVDASDDDEDEADKNNKELRRCTDRLPHDVAVTHYIMLYSLCVPHRRPEWMALIWVASTRQQ